MNRVFIDTSFVVALVNEKDQHHARASELSETFDGQPLITTDAVLLEVGNALELPAAFVATSTNFSETPALVVALIVAPVPLALIDADVTVLLYVNKTVKVNHAFKKGELNDEAIAKVLKDVPKMFEKE